MSEVLKNIRGRVGGHKRNIVVWEEDQLTVSRHFGGTKRGACIQIGIKYEAFELDYEGIKELIEVLEKFQEQKKEWENTPMI